MKKRNSALYIHDIIDAIGKIERYTQGLSFKKFSKDQLIIDAVVRNFAVIGEAAKNVPTELRTRYSDIPWKEMAGMRDKVIHEYFGVDLDIVWKTIKKSLPNLKSILKSLPR